MDSASSANSGPPLRSLLPNSRPPYQDNKGPVPRTKRSAVAAACVACRRRKTKCSGTRPRCNACLRQQLECHYEVSSSETHMQALRRKYDVLRGERDELSSYRDLFDAIKSKPSSEASATLDRIRAGESVQTVLRCDEGCRLQQHPEPGAQLDHKELYHLMQTVSDQGAEQIFKLARSGADAASVLRITREADLLLQLAVKPEIRRTYDFPYNKMWPGYLQHASNSYLQARLFDGNRKSCQDKEFDQPPYNMPFSAAKLVQPGLGEANISQWTTVIADESVLCQLLSLYLLHGNPFFRFFQKDLFLSDLIAGRHDFCSSILVNAVLAAGSHYVNTMPARNEPWNAQSLSYRFFAEAKRQWEYEMDDASLTTLQAALVMNTIYNMNGLDQIGYRFTLQAAQIAQTMELFKAPTDHDRTDMDIARLSTAWGLFSWQATVCFHYFKRPIFEATPEIELPNPQEDPYFYGEAYVQYPLSETKFSLSSSFVFFHATRFHRILNDMAKNHFGTNKRPVSFEQAVQHYARLHQWFQELTPVLQPQNIALPCQLQLHLQYQYITSLLFEPLLKTSYADTSFTVPSTAMQVTARQIERTGRAMLETIARVYYVRHSFSSYDPVMLQYLSVLGFACVGSAAAARSDLSTPEENRSTLLLMLEGLYYQARAARLSTTVFRLLYDSLPPEEANAADTFLRLNPTEVEAQAIADYIRASFPVNMVSLDGDAEKQRLDALLENAKSLEGCKAQKTQVHSPRCPECLSRLS